MGKKRELHLPSNQNLIYKIEHFVEEISDEFHLNDSYFGNILVALTEAVKNAILHGNSEDSSKKVHVVVEPKQEGLLITVTDEGTGFEFKKFEDLDALLSLEDDAGRGLTLISTLSDEVKFSNKGNTLEMLFKITGIENEIYEKRYQALKSYYQEKADTKKVDEKKENQS